MVLDPQDLDESLAEWTDVAQLCDWEALLVGNGASIAVYDGFRYGRLYDVAASDAPANRLADEDVALFETFETVNFEQIMANLVVAEAVTEALDRPPEFIAERYDSIRSALASAVHAIHVPWEALTRQTLITVKEAMREFRYVFSTNYDLLLYWALMFEGPGGFTDYIFRGDGHFDPLDVDVWRPAVTRVLFLHGGLHLVRLSGGRTAKRVRTEFEALLDLFGEPLPSDPYASPLVVTEGTSENKLRSISSSDYLSFALATFRDISGPVVAFGHSLGEFDQHIVRSMRRWQDREIAVSVLPGTDEEVVQKKAEIRAALPAAQLYFFNAFTHPLGLPELKTAA
jgi:hypothetical protein